MNPKQALHWLRLSYKKFSMHQSPSKSTSFILAHNDRTHNRLTANVFSVSSVAHNDRTHNRLTANVFSVSSVAHWLLLHVHFWHVALMITSDLTDNVLWPKTGQNMASFTVLRTSTLRHTAKYHTKLYCYITIILVAHITYTVLAETLNHAQSNNQHNHYIPLYKQQSWRPCCRLVCYLLTCNDDSLELTASEWNLTAPSILTDHQHAMYPWQQVLSHWLKLSSW